MPKDLDHLLALAEGYADQFERHEPASNDAPVAPLTLLRLAVLRRAAAEQAVLDAVIAARAARMPWAQIGGVLGVTGEAVRQRYGDRVPAPAGPDVQHREPAPYGTPENPVWVE